MKIAGVWLPIITPFRNAEVDYESYGRLVDNYLEKGISGIIPLGTTGECPTIEEYEFSRIIDFTITKVQNKIPIFVGLGGNNTKKVTKQLESLSDVNVDGILSVCPYYNRPGQEGVFEHFRALSECTDKKIVIYNIPYRTGMNIENDTLFRLSELRNITGVKDSCGNYHQTMELILNKPSGFSVLTGEDILYYPTLMIGGDGGILASAHLSTEKFVEIYNKVQANDYLSAKMLWKELCTVIPLLFEEPSPGPIKYILKKKGLISSSELRLPMTRISDKLSRMLDQMI